MAKAKKGVLKKTKKGIVPFSEGSKQVQVWKDDESTDYPDIFEGSAAEWTPEMKKAKLRAIANSPLAAYGLTSWDQTTAKMRAEIEKARNWYEGTELKTTIKARSDTEPPPAGEQSSTSSAKGEPDFIPKGFRWDPKKKKVVPIAKAKVTGRGGTGKLKPIETAEEYARARAAENAVIRNTPQAGRNPRAAGARRTPSDEIGKSITSAIAGASRSTDKAVSSQLSKVAAQARRDDRALKQAAEWLSNPFSGSSTPAKKPTVPDYGAPNKTKGFKDRKKKTGGYGR